MALRKIHKNGDSALKKKARPVSKYDSRLALLVDDMIETLKDANGVGLAAPQVGIIKRVIVIDTGEEMGAVELVNPEIFARFGEQIYYEGCLSYPGYYGNVGRPEVIKIRAFNRAGELVAYEAGGIYAVACCHEVDHLEGEMFMPKVKGPLYTLEEVKALRERAAATKDAITTKNAAAAKDAIATKNAAAEKDAIATKNAAVDRVADTYIEAAADKGSMNSIKTDADNEAPGGIYDPDSNKISETRSAEGYMRRISQS